jgi:hypothetical protein
MSVTLGIMLLSQACRGRHRPVALGGGFQSFESSAAAHARLKDLRITDSWVEHVETHSKSDSHPEYTFRSISGPFLLFDVQGELRLVFLDEQLMSTEFSTSHGDQVIAAVQKQYPGVSIRPGKEISLDDHAKFRYDIPSEGYVRLDWHDQEFEDAWSFWIKRYAPAFLENRGQEPVKKLTRRCAKDLGGEKFSFIGSTSDLCDTRIPFGSPGKSAKPIFSQVPAGSF